MKQRIPLTAINKVFGAVSAFVLAISLAGCSTASSQGMRSRPPVMTADQLVEKMSSRLNLTEEQQAAVRPIMDEQREKQTAISERYREQGRGAGLSMQDDMEALEVDVQLKLARVLTAEQMSEYREMAAEQKAFMAEQRPRRGSRGGKRPR